MIDMFDEVRGELSAEELDVPTGNPPKTVAEQYVRH